MCIVPHLRMNTYDALGRPVLRNADSFGYNARSEVVFSPRGAENAEDFYAYDTIGNRTSAFINSETNSNTANNLNQYTAIEGGASPPGEPPLCGSVPLRELQYDADGNLRDDGDFHYFYDAENRLVSARHSSLTNGAIRVLNAYDQRSRRVSKTVQRLVVPDSTPPAPPQDGEWTTTETRTYVWDGNLPVRETVRRSSGSTAERSYFWGKDLSGTLQGAGGVGGLLYEERDGDIYIPCYDNNGNVTRYLDATGATVAAYTYDAFGNLLTATGPLADDFHHRFSTKYFDPETGLYHYIYRFYHPPLMRWLNRDSIEEEGGLNLYRFCDNCPTTLVDSNGNIPFDTIWDIGNIIYDICVGDTASLTADIAALCVPYVPAGASKVGNRLVRAAEVANVKKILHTAKTLNVSYRYVRVEYHLAKGAYGSKAYIEASKGFLRTKSLWKPGTTDAHVRIFINQAMQKAKSQGLIRPDQLKGFVYDTGKIIGASRGREVRTIKLQVDSLGNIHAHPFTP